MSIWKQASPTGAIADFVTVYREAGRNRLRIGLAAAAVTASLFSVMILQSWTKDRELPKVTYINSWPADRTEAETQAFIKENQKKKEERERQEAAAAKDQQDMWMAVGRASGMNVDEIKRKAEADKAAEKARQDAAAKARLDH